MLITNYTNIGNPPIKNIGFIPASLIRSQFDALERRKFYYSYAPY